MKKRKTPQGPRRPRRRPGALGLAGPFQAEAWEDRLTRLLTKAREAVAAAPEVRAERIAALQEAIAQGTYRVDSKQVALSLIVELLRQRKKK